MIASLILAAGDSVRMGRPKALLPVDGTTFLGRILDNYRALGTGKIALVLGKNAPAVLAEIAAHDIEVVINPRPEQGQLSSLLAGIGALRPHDPAGVIVHPVDHPMVGIGTLRLVVSAALLHVGKIVIPTCRGRRGHPVVFPSTLFGELAKAPLSVGARAVTRSRISDIVEVRTGDEGILTNIDTQQEYARLRRDQPRTS
ncbi:MAG TPA: nucleotidyltransferase family protein [Bacteroidota bacterium]|nr:nucleotidyltransferase family protein [Bacteroidota bacterium]